MFTEEQNNSASAIDEKSGMIQADVYTSFENTGDIKQQWDNFIELIGSEIFLTCDWCRIWWQYYGKGRKLRIFIFKKDGNIIGIVPLFFESIRIGLTNIKVVKIVGADFTLAQFSLPIKQNYLPAVMRIIYESLENEQWDVIYLGPLAGIYKDFDALFDAAKRGFHNAKCIPIDNQNTQTYFEITSDWETYLSAISKQERSNVRRAYNMVSQMLNEAPMGIKSEFVSDSNISEYFNEFVAMHQAHWQKLGKAGHFGDWPDSKAFHEELASVNHALGRTRLLKVQLGENCLGYQYQYKFGKSYYDFLDCRNDSNMYKDIGIGRIAFCEIVKKAIAEGIKIIDSMRGTYEHKLRLGGKLFMIKGIYLIRNSSSSKIKAAILHKISYLVNIGYFRLWYCKIAPRLPMKFGPLWKYWIKTNLFASMNKKYKTPD
ncbi:MAG: GNAT family N-acetyltransferase [Alphaproteobacteria bacterium]|nr:MAG: GNAT family N-acetyltransferase [Alphaproteobacteria bacterium]